MRALEGRRILIADDEVRIGELLCAYLSGQGAIVNCAHDGAEAFRLATLGNPDAVIMDLNMPGTNGLEAIRSLRITDPQKPILVLTGYTTEENFAAAREAGASECMAKPPVLRDVCAILVKLLGQPPSAQPGT